MPDDVLERVLGFLDRDTLCTARLVSRTFCAAASEHVKIVRLRSTSQHVSLHRFPRIRCLDASVVGSEVSFAQVHPSLRNLITHFSISLSEDTIRETLSQIALMPRLRNLALYANLTWADALLHQCTNLEALTLSRCNPSSARAIAKMTWLTSLDIGSLYGAGNRGPSPEASWSQLATALTNLQALSITSSRESLLQVSSLTGLTGLTWTDTEYRNPNMQQDNPDMMEEAVYSLSPLTRLTNLRSLELHGEISDDDLDIACFLGLGSLGNLQLVGHDLADCGRFLTHQTALTRLYVQDLPSFRNIKRMDLLQYIELSPPTLLDAESLAALAKATNLTSLHFSLGIRQLNMGLTQALAGLTQLRSLGLSLPVDGSYAKVLDYPLALAPLTGLTQLGVQFGGLDDADLRALLALTGLQVLHLTGSCCTDDVVPELRVLTNLKLLNLKCSGVTSLAPVTDVLNPRCEARGLQPMAAYCLPSTYW
jgi:hypothetical protein